jgi:hypothetical protein
MAETGVGKAGSNEKEIKVEGHLIDSMILTRIWDRIMELGGDFETLEFRVGKQRDAKTEQASLRLFNIFTSPNMKRLRILLRQKPQNLPIICTSLLTSG